MFTPCGWYGRGGAGLPSSLAPSPSRHTPRTDSARAPAPQSFGFFHSTFCFEEKQQHGVCGGGTKGQRAGGAAAPLSSAGTTDSFIHLGWGFFFVGRVGFVF